MATCDEQIRRELPRFLARIDFFRERCPEAVKMWIGVHVHVFDAFLEEPARQGVDARTARHVATETRATWKGLSAGPAL